MLCLLREFVSGLRQLVSGLRQLLSGFRQHMSVLTPLLSRLSTGQVKNDYLSRATKHLVELFHRFITIVVDNL